MKLRITIQACVFALLSLLGGVVMAQGQRVTGTVIDDAGEGLPGVSIIIKGTTSGTVTDLDGKFSVEANSSDVLTFSFVGYVTKEVEVNGRSAIDIQMQPDVTSLEEVVVVGYGTQKKSDIISSVASVNTDQILKVPSTDMGEMLRGKVAGVFVTTDNAGPGGSTNLLIRGKRTLANFDGTDSNAPIIIADGVQIGGINDVNPNDIESMEILKDAAAQAIYGARASNGVVLITTKRGKKGETRVNYNGYYGVQSVNRTFDIYSAEEFAQLKREAFRTDNNDNYLNDADIFTATEYEVLQSGEYIDWEKELLRVAPIQSHNLSVSTGTERTTAYAAINYNNQEGVIPGTDFDRINIRLNADQKINDWLKLGVNTSWQLSNKNNPGTGGTLQSAITTSPLGKIYNEDGSYKVNPTDQQESFNPLLDISEVVNFEEDRNDIMNVFLDISPIKGFNYRINASRRSWNRKTENYNSTASLTGLRNSGTGTGYLRYQDSEQFQLENIITYDLPLDGSKHGVNITAVQSMMEENYNDTRIRGAGIPNDLLGIYGLETALTFLPEVGGNQKQLLSYVGRVQYDYDGRYYINASFRGDGSSVFGANNKWAYFPAVAVGWNIYRENFMTSLDMVSNLKLRASYGSVGNTAIPAYRSQALAVQRDYLFNDQKSVGYIAGSELPNPDLRWETSTTLNLALDFGLFTNRISGTVEWYDTRTTDLLVRQSVDVPGYSSTLSNIGEVQNRGLELALNAIVVETQDFNFSLGANITRNRNEIISLYGEDADGDGVEDDDIANRWFIGRPIDVTYGYLPVGIFQYGEDIANSHQPDQQPGTVKLYDRDPEDGLLNDTDRVIRNTAADWYGSFTANAGYKGFDLSATVYTVQGVLRNNPFLYGYNEGGSLRGIYNGVKQDYWTPENQTGNWPRPSEANDPDYIWTLGMQDASYIRLQNVTLGYTLPSSVLERINMTKIRVYVSGQNLFTWTDFQSYSPEKNPNDYPEARTIIGGLQIAF
ncbi:SusC/RagA family TonB-linked outer membrane protein [Reichenbachiella ulvae]|uniref:TonB-dependent receptor n=1 Tax=Reichenbachiella ulvae TaxID=2980104 RepID=A0ABT3CUW3_9BACT|nr:TonB-dependent receptor [Reichenbachiella ulvae]MCV9387422.1 TonB-dependent receptor [Reichenbachiella ulvae]